ncbi:MAG TPA: hypothetical protein VKY92_21145 [Verrucomicrobiae bacterium]|nr:hypothetical protein [Verrucomicrobiae bacterium]
MANNADNLPLREQGSRVFAFSKHARSSTNERAAKRRSCEPPGPDGSMRFWRMHQLWEMAEGLPIKRVKVCELDGFDEVHWFGGPRKIQPTCRAIAEHARDIFNADLAYPIIMSPTGEVLDGWHRICKAFIQGVDELDAVQLPTLPPYRWRVLITGEEVEILDQPEQPPGT